MTKDAPAYPPEAPKDCPLCPRLVAFRRANQEKYPDYFNGAVPSFVPEGGEESTELLVVGLAPGIQGANRTGRPFTGDYAGDLLYSTLTTFGFTAGTFDARPDDGFRLKRAMVTNAVRCVPPENKPVGAEANACRPFLVSRMESLPRLKVIISLGKISHDNTVRALGGRLSAHPFGHNADYQIETGHGPVTLLSSYHCSRYNTNTGRLTESMFHDVFGRAAALCDQ
ncbi:uracil-DNA glycosylase [Parvularcula sp. LCG005]|uniref:uracil-DNA glycosylase n=1 Tax=Parvularcula sp. LCG005 TaxID=3078805 RepID=UPI002943F817|nr:uracil-DNA glycosylase [Parvularcula sp. LCG005]WOI54249.1 uracil-DNA glycosylase [Parvularcula sp. LCG005]